MTSAGPVAWSQRQQSMFYVFDWKCNIFIIKDIQSYFDITVILSKQPYNKIEATNIF